MKKKYRKKTSAGQHKRHGGAKQSRKRWWEWRHLYPVLLIMGAFILFVNFLIRFSKLPDTTNEHINSHLNYLIPLEYGLFSLIAGCMVYFIVTCLRKDLRIKNADRYVLLLSFLAISTLYILCFKGGISENGDDAEYIINAKSLVEKGGIYRLYTREERPNPLASIGLPLILAPVYYFRELDFLWMKVLVMTMGLAVFPLLFILFRQYHDFKISAILSIACFSSPYLISVSSNIMTETPYLFWSVLALFMAIRYSEKTSFNWKYGGLLLIPLIMTYLTRAVGISVFIAVFTFLILKIPWKDLIMESGWLKRISHPSFKKFVFLAFPLFVFGIIWQLRHPQVDVSQASYFFNSQLFDQFPKNAKTALGVVSQVLFSDDTFRWANLKFDYYLEELNFKWVSILIVILIGLINGLIKKNLIALYTLLTMIVLFLANMAISYDVMTRYLIILIPFFIYFFMIGIFTLFDLVNRLASSPWGESVPPLLRRSGYTGAMSERRDVSAEPRPRGTKSSHLSSIGSVVCMLLLLQLLFSNFSSTGFYVAEQKTGNTYSPGFDNYLKSARWCKYYLPSDSYVLSRKPRIFYLISGLKGEGSTGGRDTYSEAFEKRKLESFQSSGATHLVLDGFNYLTYLNIAPIVNNNPDKFTTIFRSGEMEGICYILKLNMD